MKHLLLKISNERFIPLDLIPPPGDWFTDGHLQEILTAIADSFYDLYSTTEPKVIRTPRCTFSFQTRARSGKIYLFVPIENPLHYDPFSSVPKLFCIRVLGRGDLGISLTKNTKIDSALRIIPS